jgi:hypothetical protein
MYRKWRGALETRVGLYSFLGFIDRAILGRRQKKKKKKSDYLNNQ